jgi:hypothetical protein
VLGALAVRARKRRARDDGLDDERTRAYADVVAFASHAVFATAEGEPARFAEVGWPWQTQLLEMWAANRLVVVLKARQLGVSWLAALFALWTATRRPGQEVLLVSRNQADATRLLDKVAYLYARLPAWKPDAVVNMRSIRFAQGSVIEALPATENVGRSRTAALVVLDEHAHQPFARKILLAVMAVAEKGRILSISSANGRGALHSQLYAAAKEGTNGWKAVFIPASAHPDRRDPAWRERERAALSQLSDADFAQEYPESDLEAIAVTGRPVFRPEDLERQSIESGVTGPPGLVVYREPEIGKVYLIGADVAEGLANSDWSSAVVLERDSGEQVAQLRGRWPPDIYAAKIDDLARRYGVYSKGGWDVTTIVAVERNNHGHAVLLRLRQLHSPEGKPQAPYVIYRAKDKRQGWLTGSANRSVLVDQLEAGLRNGSVQLHDTSTIDQLSAFAWSDEGRAEAPDGYHDDDVLALGIAWQVRSSSFPRVLGLREFPA